MLPVFRSGVGYELGTRMSPVYLCNRNILTWNSFSSFQNIIGKFSCAFAQKHGKCVIFYWVHCRICAGSSWSDWNISSVHVGLLYPLLDNSEHLCNFNEWCHWGRRCILYPLCSVCARWCFWAGVVNFCDIVLLATFKWWMSFQFSTAAPRLWNTLPTDIKWAATVLAFKKKLKTLLFSKLLCYWDPVVGPSDTTDMDLFTRRFTYMIFTATHTQSIHPYTQ